MGRVSIPNGAVRAPYPKEVGSPVQRLEAGLRLGDRYVLQERIASGGMADVWSGLDDVLQRVVAVKVMRADPENEEIFAERFRDEALHSAALMHTNITTVFDYGEDDHLTYLVMELVAGQPLSAVIREQGALSPEVVRSVLAQAALALGTAHEAGVVHRDVKPANILVREDGVVKLTDFGIARAMDAIGHTRVGEMLGTPNYISPEQAVGEQATGASDLYALGVVAHEMLTGTRPSTAGPPSPRRCPTSTSPRRRSATTCPPTCAPSSRPCWRRTRPSVRPTPTTSPHCSAWRRRSSRGSTSTSRRGCRAATSACR